MLSDEELNNRFGFHKATLEGPNATAPKHAALREEFLGFANYLNLLLPDCEEKGIAFRQLENASMWAHKTIAQTAPLIKVPTESDRNPILISFSEFKEQLNKTEYLTKQPFVESKHLCSTYCDENHNE